MIVLENAHMCVTPSVAKKDMTFRHIRSMKISPREFSAIKPSIQATTERVKPRGISFQNVKWINSQSSHIIQTSSHICVRLYVCECVSVSETTYELLIEIARILSLSLAFSLHHFSLVS